MLDPIIAKLLLLVVIAIGFAWGGATKDRQWRRLQFNRFAVFLFAVLAGSSVYLVYSAFSADPGPPVYVLIFLLTVCVAALIALLEVSFASVWFDDTAIHYQSGFGRRTSIEISTVVSCAKGPFACFVIKTDDGRQLTVSQYFSGVGEFIQSVRDKIS